MYKEFLTVSQSPEFTARVLSYEVGDIHKCMVAIERFGQAGYHGELGKSCGDACIMLSLLIEQLGFDEGKLREDGLETFKERMRECLEATRGLA